MKIFTALSVAFVVLAGAGWLVARQDRTPLAVEHPAAPDTSVQNTPVRALLLAQPFELEKPATHHWRAEQPQYLRGWILVLECDPSRLARRQTVEPLLASDGEMLERINEGAKHGRVIAVLPRFEAGEPSAPKAFAFVEAERAEALDAVQALRSFERAGDALRLSAEAWQSARARGGEAIRFEDRTQLEEHCAQLILEHAPEDRAQAEGWLIPRSNRRR
jgi:hypothetical protein